MNACFATAALTAAVFAAPDPASKGMIGYYASWQIYDRAKLAAPANLDLSQWNRVNFAFLQAALDGSIHGTDPEADPQVLFGSINWYDADGSKSMERSFSAMVKPYQDGVDLQQNLATPATTTSRYNKGTGLIELAHKAGTEVFASIGGWSLSSNFPAVAASASARNRFAHEAAGLVRDWGLDGIDIDWEYPGYTDHHGTGADGANYLLLLAELRDSLRLLATPMRARAGLTAALPCGSGNIDAMDVPKLAAVLDEMNLMTYDFHGAFDAETNHNSPLTWNGIGDSQFTVAGCVENWVRRGAPRSRLNIGSGFYGRSFATAKTLGSAHGGNDLAHWPADEGMPSYYNIAAQAANLEFHWDAQAQVPWATFPGGGLVSFEDTVSERLRGAWVREQGISGVIVWEMSGDVMADKSTPLAAALRKALGPRGISAAIGETRPSRLGAPGRIAGYQVFTSQGKWIASGLSESGGRSGGLGHLPRGMHLVRMVDHRGQVVSESKLVVP